MNLLALAKVAHDKSRIHDSDIQQQLQQQTLQQLRHLDPYVTMLARELEPWLDSAQLCQYLESSGIFQELKLQVRHDLENDIHLIQRLCLDEKNDLEAVESTLAALDASVAQTDDDFECMSFSSEFSDVAERVPELIQDLDAEREDDISQTVLALREHDRDDLAMHSEWKKLIEKLLEVLAQSQDEHSYRRDVADLLLSLVLRLDYLQLYETHLAFVQFMCDFVPHEVLEFQMAWIQIFRVFHVLLTKIAQTWQCYTTQQFIEICQGPVQLLQIPLASYLMASIDPYAEWLRYWLLHCPERHILLQALEETQCLACIVHRLETSHGGVRTQGDAIQLTQDLFILCQVMHYIDLAKNDVVFHWCLEILLDRDHTYAALAEVPFFYPMFENRLVGLRHTDSSGVLESWGHALLTLPSPNRMSSSRMYLALRVYGTYLRSAEMTTSDYIVALEIFQRAALDGSSRPSDPVVEASLIPFCDTLVDVLPSVLLQWRRPDFQSLVPFVHKVIVPTMRRDLNNQQQQRQVMRRGFVRLVLAHGLSSLGFEQIMVTCLVFPEFNPHTLLDTNVYDTPSQMTYIECCFIQSLLHSSLSATRAVMESKWMLHITTSLVLFQEMDLLAEHHVVEHPDLGESTPSSLNLPIDSSPYIDLFISIVSSPYFLQWYVAAMDTNHEEQNTDILLSNLNQLLSFNGSPSSFFAVYLSLFLCCNVFNKNQMLVHGGLLNSGHYTGESEKSTNIIDSCRLLRLERHERLHAIFSGVGPKTPGISTEKYYSLKMDQPFKANISSSQSLDQEGIQLFYIQESNVHMVQYHQWQPIFESIISANDSQPHQEDTATITREDVSSLVLAVGDMYGASLNLDQKKLEHMFEQCRIHSIELNTWTMSLIFLWILAAEDKEADDQQLVLLLQSHPHLYYQPSLTGFDQLSEQIITQEFPHLCAIALQFGYPVTVILHRWTKQSFWDILSWPAVVQYLVWSFPAPASTPLYRIYFWLALFQHLDTSFRRVSTTREFIQLVFSPMPSFQVDEDLVRQMVKKYPPASLAQALDEL